MVEVKNLTKKYGSKTVLDNVSFDVKDGEILGFLGPNGAGKSTTMNIITGYISANSGSCTVDGVDILENPTEYKRKIGYLPEIPPLYKDMTVREYLNFVCELKGSDKSCIETISREVKIDAVSGRLIKNLSKGYRQRVGIAQALVGDPELLILDEPTVGLDPMQIIDVRNVINELGKKKTLIISSHILSEISAVASRVLIINKGKIIAEDTPDNLASKISGKNKYSVRIEGEHEKIDSLLGSVHEVEHFEYIGSKEDGAHDYMISSVGGADIRKILFKKIADASMVMLMFKSSDVSLEDILISLTAEGEREGNGEKSESNN